MKPVAVFSLTESGRRLADRLAPALPGADFEHRPPGFQDRIRDCFLEQRPLVMICATGIVVRTLAPVLRDKHRDPPVLVLDEQGRYVVPLLSGHEGGANAWGQKLAEAIGAECVVTGARSYTRPVWVAGLGCERGCEGSALERLLLESLAAQDLQPQDLSALSSIELKRDEAGLLDLGAKLGKEIGFYSATRLAEYTERLSDRSEAVFRATGCYGVAEAAALAHAESLTGCDAELVIPKRKGYKATFALARAFEEKA